MVHYSALPKLISVKALAPYRLAVAFADGIKGNLDLSHLSKTDVFKEWDSNDLFSKVYLAKNGAIAWNEELEIDPLSCYLKIAGLSFEQWQQKQKYNAAA